MVFKKFSYTSVFYLLVIILLTGIGVYILFNTYFWLTSLWIFLIDIILIITFLNFIKREHRKLSHFLRSVDQDDFSPPYAKNYEDLDFNEAFDKLSKVIISLRDEAQINYQYLQTIVNHINTALICVDESGKIVLSNDSSNRLFKKQVLRDITSLHISSDDLPGVIEKLKSNEKKLVKFNINGELFNYSIQMAKFKLRNESFRLFSFQNVQSELEQNELESWQKLTRVMSHEIMNSVIPISNLSALVFKKLYDDKNHLIEDAEKEKDIKESLQTIESRSKSLAKFVEATRNFTRMPKPEFEEIIIKQLINRVITLLRPKLEESKINLIQKWESDDLKILADRLLIEQALINIMLNAIEALQENTKRNLTVKVLRNEENHILICIIDNGRGIAANELENIFIPFYTTKRGGSGIGLSLAKQIMFLHKGNIIVKSKQGEGTRFLLSF